MAKRATIAPFRSSWAPRISVLLLAAAQAHAAPSLPTLYTLHCSGCHGAAGHGAPSAGIPDFRDAGLYLAVPQGRAYLAQVPGIAESRLDDVTAAAMLNWVLTRYSTLPPNFVPYTAAEMGRLRGSAASDADTRRATIIASLARLNRLPAGYANTRGD